MTRRRLLAVMLAVGLVVALPAASFAAHTCTATGRANLHPVGASGVHGKFTFVDNGSDTITMSGTATGLTQGQTYVSLIYDVGSVPGGPTVCEPTGPDLFGKMLVGEAGVLGFFTWDVDGDGNGTITGTNFLNEEEFGVTAPPFLTAEYVSLGEFDTISIRHLEAGFEAVACGQVATHKGK